MNQADDLEKWKSNYIDFIKDFQEKGLTAAAALEQNETSFKTCVDSIINLIEFYPLHTTVALHAQKILFPFLKAANKFYGKYQKSESSFVKEIEDIVRKIYANGFDCFLKKEDPFQDSILEKYSEIFSEYQLSHAVKAEDLTKYIKQDKSTINLREILVELYEIAQIKDSFPMRTKLNIFIQNRILIEEPKRFLEEISLNWIKKKVEMVQKELPSYLCCKIHFQRFDTSKMTGFNESQNSEFKDYRWPLENQSIKFHLTKTFVGFLNTTGGIIYVGLKEDKFKMVQVKGIELSKQQKIDFIYFIHDQILAGVYPRESDRQQDEEEDRRRKMKDEKSPYKLKLKKQFEREKSLKQGYEYTINKYVSVDFIDVFDKETYLNSVGQKQRLYIVRIKIKIGNPRELYHVISKHNIPETFIREDKMVKRKDIKQFYTLFYKRIGGSDTQPPQNDKKDPHSLCRFNPKPILYRQLQT